MNEIYYTVVFYMDQFYIYASTSETLPDYIKAKLKEGRAERIVDDDAVPGSVKRCIQIHPGNCLTGECGIECADLDEIYYGLEGLEQMKRDLMIKQLAGI